MSAIGDRRSVRADRQSLTADRRPFVMLVDDDPMTLATMMRIAIVGGFSPMPCRGLTDVKAWFYGDVRPTVVITDVFLGRESGVDVHDWVRATAPEIPVTFVTGGDARGLPKSCKVLSKPYEIGQFLDVLGQSETLATRERAARDGR